LWEKKRRGEIEEDSKGRERRQQGVKKKKVWRGQENKSSKRMCRVRVIRVIGELPRGDIGEKYRAEEASTIKRKLRNEWEQKVVKKVRKKKKLKLLEGALFISKDNGGKKQRKGFDWL